jgi:amidohydrolase
MTITFLGKTSHATVPEDGIDAIAMASEAYVKLKDMVKEEAKGQRYIWSVGRFQGGHVHNVIADRCEMDISYRFYDMDFANRVEAGTRRVCEDIAKAYGGKVEINFKMSTGPVHNDEKLCEDFVKVLEKEGLPLDIVGTKLSSEDFGWYLTKVPGVFFRFGTRNEELGHTGTAHQNDYTIDEEGMRYGLRAFVAYILAQ